jgi:hypothetical protein
VITSLYVRKSLLIVPVLLASACSPEAPEVTRTVSYYRENAEERQQMIERCADNPGTLGRTPNCVNAKQAELRDVPSLRDLPSIGLSERESEPSNRQDSPTADEKR